MNFLAHVFLSRQSPQTIVGAMLGDFVKGPIDDRYPPPIRDAIALHRAIDRYTDTHDIPRVSRARMSPARRFFSAVLVDVFYDHFLARDWRRYCDIPLPVFARQVYDALAAQRADLPPRLQWAATRMAADDWLTAYGEIAGINAAVNGIAYRLRRFRRAQVLVGSVEELEQHYAGFEDDFRVFFPQLMRYVATPG